MINAGWRYAYPALHLNPRQETPYMKNATFYLLDNDTHQDGLSAVEQLVCEIAAERWRAGKRVLIACEDEQQAIRPMKRYGRACRRVLFRITCRAKVHAVGHRWRLPAAKRNSSARDILISLRTDFADFATAFTEVVDFVPYEESLKQLARERYKAYRPPVLT